jgi:hypothetical protein
MKAKLLFLAIPLFILWACKKEKADTKPNLTLKNVKIEGVSTTSGTGTILEIDFDVLDKEGDVRDSIFIKKIDAAKIPCSGNSKNLFYNIPAYPIEGKEKISFRLKFSTLNIPDYALLGGAACSPRKDTSIFKFWVKDKAGNLSDTVTTEALAFPF